MARYLDDHLLDAFEAALRNRGALITDSWAQGLTDDEIDELLLPVDIDLPEEARRWWRWHNGTIHGDAGPGNREITPGRDIWALHGIADDYQDFRDPRRDSGDPDGLLQAVGNKPIILFHCAVSRDALVPVYVQDDWAVAPVLALPSIGELIATWIDYLDRGIFSTNPDGTWEYANRRQPPEETWKLGIY